MPVVMPGRRPCLQPAAACNLRQVAASVAGTSNLLQVAFPDLALPLQERGFLCKPVFAFSRQILQLRCYKQTLWVL